MAGRKALAPRQAASERLTTELAGLKLRSPLLIASYSRRM